MSVQNVFNTVIGPSLEKLPLLELTQAATLNGRNFVVTYAISKNILTDFDRKLSEHLAAIKGGGFPPVTLEVRVAEKGSKESWSPAPDEYLKSVLHALKRVGEYALGDRDKARISLISGSAPSGQVAEVIGERCEVTPYLIDSISKALDLCGTLGEFEFLRMSANYDAVLVTPVGHDMPPVSIDFGRGTVTVPPLDRSSASFECSLYNFTRELAANPAAAAYVARARHNLANAKEDAIFAFRAAAQERIMGFDRALAGRPLDSFRLDAAVTLVSRLKAGLGDNLLGLSEEAQITALEWAASINARNWSRENAPSQPYPFRSRRIGGTA